MNILLASSEVAPFAKTGGLADVCGALPAKLAALGHEVAVIMPAYRAALQSGLPIESTDVRFNVPIGGKIVSAEVLRSKLPQSDVPVYLVAQDSYFDRPELYQENGRDYHDNCERFVFFCRSVLEALGPLELDVDLIHCNDWQTSLIPIYLQLTYHKAPGYENIASLLTIHNLAFQGRFWHWDMLLTGLDWRHFNWQELEFYGDLNLLKGGIVFADSINTVSPRYAQEIQHAPLGCGLESVLRHRRDVLCGIINGVDYNIWNPETDQYLEENYNVDTFRCGKRACKASLQRELGLETRGDLPLIGMVGRLTEQKGWNLVADVMQRWLASEPAQWVILGTGAPKYHAILAQLAQRWPQKLAVRLEFSDRLAHRIEAASDTFVMASRFEPCGLNQLYSLKYGSVPVAHATGGLADTIIDADAETLEANIANGFSFTSHDPTALDHTLLRAGDTYRHHPDVWERIVRVGMSQDWSWTRSAKLYEELYKTTIARRRNAVAV